MAPLTSVLIGTQAEDLGALIAGWVRSLGYTPQVLHHGPLAVACVRRGSLAASFVDCHLEAARGQPVWRVVRPILGRRLILMARERNNEFWFEALRAGVGSVLPLPPAEPMVRAALSAVPAS